MLVKQSPDTFSHFLSVYPLLIILDSLQIGKNIFIQFFYDGRRDLASVIYALGIIDNGDGDDLGILRRFKSDKGGDVPSAAPWQGLARGGLPADGVSFYISLLSSALGNHLFQHEPKKGRGFLRYYPFPYLVIELFDITGGRVLQRDGKMGRYPFSAVYQGTDGWLLLILRMK